LFDFVEQQIPRAARDDTDGLPTREFQRTVVLDIGLPRMDGYAVARGLRALPALTDATIIACSGYGRDDVRGADSEV